MHVVDKAWGLAERGPMRLFQADNPHVLTAEEFRRRKTKRDHFLTRVLESSQIFVVGGQDDLEAMG